MRHNIVYQLSELKGLLIATVFLSIFFGLPKIVQPLLAKPLSDTTVKCAISRVEQDRLLAMHFAVEPRNQIRKFFSETQSHEHLQGLNQTAISFFDSKELQKNFPNYLFYISRTQQDFKPGEARLLHVRNQLFAISPSSKEIAPIASLEQLKRFLLKHAPFAKTRLERKCLLEASLQLAKEIEKNDVYKYQIDLSTFASREYGTVFSGAMSCHPLPGIILKKAFDLKFDKSGRLGEIGLGLACAGTGPNSPSGID